MSKRFLILITLSIALFSQILTTSNLHAMEVIASSLTETEKKNLPNLLRNPKEEPDVTVHELARVKYKLTKAEYEMTKKKYEITLGKLELEAIELKAIMRPTSETSLSYLTDLKELEVFIRVGENLLARVVCAVEIMEPCLMEIGKQYEYLYNTLRGSKKISADLVRIKKLLEINHILSDIVCCAAEAINSSLIKKIKNLKNILKNSKENCKISNKEYEIANEEFEKYNNKYFNELREIDLFRIDILSKYIYIRDVDKRLKDVIRLKNIINNFTCFYEDELLNLCNNLESRIKLVSEPLQTSFYKAHENKNQKYQSLIHMHEKNRELQKDIFELYKIKIKNEQKFNSFIKKSNQLSLRLLDSLKNYSILLEDHLEKEVSSRETIESQTIPGIIEVISNPAVEKFFTPEYERLFTIDPLLARMLQDIKKTPHDRSIICKSYLNLFEPSTKIDPLTHIIPTDRNEIKPIDLCIESCEEFDDFEESDDDILDYLPRDLNDKKSKPLENSEKNSQDGTTDSKKHNSKDKADTSHFMILSKSKSSNSQESFKSTIISNIHRTTFSLSKSSYEDLLRNDGTCNHSPVTEASKEQSNNDEIECFSSSKLNVYSVMASKSKSSNSQEGLKSTIISNMLAPTSSPSEWSFEDLVRNNGACNHASPTEVSKEQSNNDEIELLLTSSTKHQIKDEKNTAYFKRDGKLKKLQESFDTTISIFPEFSFEELPYNDKSYNSLLTSEISEEMKHHLNTSLQTLQEYKKELKSLIFCGKFALGSAFISMVLLILTRFI